jgi:hypothetical protein
MKKTFVLGMCMVFLVVMGQLAVAAPKWPVGAFKTAVVATDDATHKAEAAAAQDGNMWTIKAGGNDIWGSADQFTYVYKEVSGDFDVAVTVHTLEHTNDWSKAGVMARQDLTPGSINVYAACRGLDDLVTFQRRDTADGSSASERLTPADGLRPVTVRLIRKGNEFTGGWSLDGGATWEPNISNDGVSTTAPQTVNMADPILLGIAVTSHQAGVIATSEVEVLGDVTSAVLPDEKLSVTWGSIKSNH